MKELKDSIALVTGAGSGIGRAIALMLARKGCHIILNDISRESCEQVAREVMVLGRESRVLIYDLTEKKEAEELCHKALGLFGRIDILVNNAGIAVSGRLEDIPLDDWDRIINLNLKAHIYITRLLVSQMIARGRGHIVNIASFAGVWGPGYLLPYATTKFGVVGFSEALAAQLYSAGVGVTVVCPMFVRTPLIKSVVVPGDAETQSSFSRASDRVYDYFCVTPERVARKVVRAIRRNRLFLVTHIGSYLIIWGRIFFPKTFYRINGWITDRILPKPKREGTKQDRDRKAA